MRECSSHQYHPPGSREGVGVSEANLCERGSPDGGRSGGLVPELSSSRGEAHSGIEAEGYRMY